MITLPFSDAFLPLNVQTIIRIVEPANPVNSKRLSDRVCKLPDAPIVVDVEPHQEAASQRRAEHRQRRERGKSVATATPDVIRLPAYFGSGSGDYLAEARANYQAKIDASAPASKPYEYTGGYYGSYSYYSRNR